MSGPEVLSAFDGLKEALRQEQERIADAIRQATIQRDFAKAQQLLNQAQRIERFLSVVRRLREAWELLELPVPTPEIREIISDRPLTGLSSSTPETPELAMVNRLFSGSSVGRGRRRREMVNKIPQRAYYIPILEALEELGGRGTAHQVLDVVYRRMKDRLTEDDLQPLPSGRVLRWHNTAQWARLDLVRDGLLRRDSPQGIWEISEAGRLYLQEIRRKEQQEETQ